jgi:hypothetical protein
VGIAPLLIVTVLHAGDADLSRLSPVEVKDRAETAFAEGSRRHDDPDAARPYFRTAAACFDELRLRGAANATLYRNLGNSYLLGGDLPHAILSYRRGLHFAPGDRGLTSGLEAARGLVNYPAGNPLGRPGPAGQASWLGRMEGEWLIAGAAVLYIAACVGLTRWLMTRRRLLLAGSLVALTGAGLLTVVAVSEVAGKPFGSLVVIAEDGVLLRKGDSLSFPPRYQTPVNRGVEGQLLAERGKWLQIELSGGEAGWLMSEYALIDRDSRQGR